jgi:ubiquinone/menaquinone biosynthesis C-methylase UbiE
MFTNPEKNIVEFGFLPGQKIVDIGSGSGHYALGVARAVGQKGRVYAVDKEEELLVRLYNKAEEEGLDNVRVIIGDVEKEKGTQLKDEAVDGVVLSNIFFHLRSKQKVVQEVCRILVPGGRVGVVEWSDTSYLSALRAKDDLVLLSEAEAKELFTKCGFIYERSFDAGEHHYGLIFKKSVQPAKEESQ